MKLIIQGSVMVTGTMQFDPDTGLLMPLDPKTPPYHYDFRHTCLVIGLAEEKHKDTTNDTQKNMLGQVMLAQFMQNAAEQMTKSNPGARLDVIQLAKSNDEIN